MGKHVFQLDFNVHIWNSSVNVDRVEQRLLPGMVTSVFMVVRGLIIGQK
jgi:hypothetical protein